MCIGCSDTYLQITVGCHCANANANFRKQSGWMSQRTHLDFRISLRSVAYIRKNVDIQIKFRINLHQPIRYDCRWRCRLIYRAPKLQLSMCDSARYYSFAFVFRLPGDIELLQIEPYG